MERWSMLGGMLLVHVAAAPNEKLFTSQHRADLWPWTVSGCSLSECTRDHRRRRRRAAGATRCRLSREQRFAGPSTGVTGGGGADRRIADRRAEVVRRFKIELFGSRL